MRTPDEGSGSAAWEYASAYLAEVQPGQDFQALRLENVSVDSDHSVHVYLSARIRPPLLSILVPDGIEVTAHGSSRFEDEPGPVHRLVRPPISASINGARAYRLTRLLMCCEPLRLRGCIRKVV